MFNHKGPPAPALTISLCLLGALCEGFDVQAAGVAAAGISHDLHPAPQALGLFFSASGAGLLLGALIGGRASDHFGRKVVLVASIAAFGSFSLLTALAPGMTFLTVARFLTGLGLGGAMPNLVALAADWSDARRRNGSIAVAYIGMPLGGVVASLVVSVIPLEAWRAVFQLGGAAPLLIVPLMICYLPAKTAVPDSDATGASIRSSALQQLFRGNRLATTLFLWAGFFLIVLILHLMLNWLPLLLIGRGLPRSQAALAQAAFNIGGAAAGLCIGVLLDSRWKQRALLASLLALPVILLSIALCSPKPGILFGLSFLLGGGIISQQVILFAVATACYPIEARGTATGAAVAAGRLGSLVGPLVASSLIAAGRGPSQVLVGVLPLVILCGLCVGSLGWRRITTQDRNVGHP